MFRPALLNFNIKVSSLLEQAIASNDPKDLKILTKYLITGSRALRKAYKDEFTQELKDKKVLTKIEFISFLVNEEVKHKIAKYHIDDEAGELFIEFNEGPPLKAKLANLNELIETLLFIPQTDDIYFMLLGYFTVHENYQFIQLYNALT